MRASWVMLCGLTVLACLVPGCRKHLPVTEPRKQAEVMSEPPPEARYNRGSYPKEAFNSDDPLRKSRDPDVSNPITPTRGFGAGGGPGMMPTPGSRPY